MSAVTLKVIKLQCFDNFKCTYFWVSIEISAIEICPRCKCIDVLFKYLLDSPEIASYVLQSMTLGQLHICSIVFLPLMIAVPEVIYRKSV